MDMTDQKKLLETFNRYFGAAEVDNNEK